MNTNETIFELDKITYSYPMEAPVLKDISLTMSTPMVDLLAVLRRLKVPKLLIELMGLIYRSGSQGIRW